MTKTLSIYLLLTINFLNISFTQETIDSINIQTKKIDERGFYVKIGDTVPNISFSLDDETTITLNELKGKVVMLQFTASWCGVCHEEMPHIEKELWQKYKDKGLYVIGVDYDEPFSKLQKFKKQTKITYPLALDPEAKIFELFAGKLSGVTRNVVIDQSGKIIFLSRLFEMEEFILMVETIEKQLQINP